MKFTRHGYIEVWRGEQFVSRHTAAEEAYESAYGHALAHGGAIYMVRYPPRSIDLRGVGEAPPPAQEPILVTIHQAAQIRAGGAGVSVTVADRYAPSVPAGLTATAVSSSQINLAWNASIDSGPVAGGVAGYRIRRGGAVIVSLHPTTTYSDTGLVADTLYSYTVSALDAAGNESAQSASAGARTNASVGVMYFQDGFESGNSAAWAGYSQGGFTYPTSGSYNGTYHARGALTQGAQNDNNVLIDYGTPGDLGTQIRNFYAQVALSYDTYTGNPGEHKNLIFQYYDSTYNGGSFSNANRKYQVLFNISGADGRYEVAIFEWNPATGQFVAGGWCLQNSTNYTPLSSVNAWDVFRFQIQLDTVSSGNLGPGTGNGIIRVWRNQELIINYTNVNIRRANPNVGMGRIILTTQSSGNWLATSTAQYYDRFQLASDAATLDAMPPAAVPRIAGVPAQVTGLTATPVSSSQINLSWTAVAGATSYTVRRGGAVIASGVTGTTYQNTGLTASTQYSYAVSAVNGAGEGPQSAAVLATTQASGGSGSLTVGYASNQNITAPVVVLDLARAPGANYPLWVQSNDTIRPSTHTLVASGGYFGRGYSRFVPGYFNQGQGYCAIGQIHGFANVGADSRYMVLGYLIRHGTTLWGANNNSTGAFKQVILIKSSGSRPMIIPKTGSSTRVLAPCDGTVCQTAPAGNPPDYHNEGNWGPNINLYLGQWVWMEYQIDCVTPFNRVRLWTADGVHNGTTVINTLMSPGGQMTDLDVLGGYVIDIVNPDANSYFDLERVEIRIGSAANITPPSGFPGSLR